jgi:hypothetical protein
MLCSGAGSKITHTRITGSWFATNTNGLVTQTASGGLIQGIQLLNSNVYSCTGHAVWISDSGATDIQIGSCAICGNTGDGVRLESGVSNVSITGCKIGSGFAQPNNTGYGLVLGLNANCIITENDLRGNTSEQGVPTAGSINGNYLSGAWTGSTRQR